jgi:hypothetical protein
MHKIYSLLKQKAVEEWIKIQKCKLKCKSSG